MIGEPKVIPEKTELQQGPGWRGKEVGDAQPKAEIV